MSKKDDENALLAHVRSLSATDEATIRIFQRQDHEWCCVEADAEVAAQIVYHTTSAIRKIGTSQRPMCSMNTTLLRNLLLEALQQRSLRVELYEQEVGSRLRWKTNPKEASPGNLQAVEDLIGANADQRPVVVAVRVGNSPTGERSVGISYVDAESRLLGLSQFADNDLFSNLESLVIQLGAKELLIPEDKSADTKRIVEMMGRLGVLVTYRKLAQFATKDVDHDLEKLTGKSSLELQDELSMDVALGACGAALRFLGVLAESANLGQYAVERHDLNQFMKLDSAALRALNVMPSVRDGSKSMSLFGLLNNCRTISGSRLLAQWLKQPLMDPEAIKQRHDLVEEFINNTVLRSRVQEDLMHVVPDLGKIQRKFHTQKAKLEDVVRIYHLAIRIPEFIQELSAADHEGLKAAYIGPLLAAQNDLVKFVELVETTIDLAALERHEYVVKADFDDHLVELKEQKANTYAEMEEEFERVSGLLSTDKIKFEDNPTLGWSFRLTRADAGILRNQSGFIDLKTQKSGQIFTTKQLRALANRHQELGELYSKAQSSVSREVVNIASTYLPVLGPLAATLAHLDVIMSFAHISAFSKLPYVRPKFDEDCICLKQARHPCMEVQNDMMFIPNDVTLQRKSSEFSIITGPNMGGKSTYIRQIGVICHMAQIGCFVPCEEANLTLVDSILARVGAGDSQLKGISTFMAEMLETASILKSATSRSLIIVDELGRGTSTYDGFGLAWAISQHIVEHIGSWCLFATHFHELTALADKYSNVANLHVVANAEGQDDDITLLYKVAPGIAERSFGIHVAEVVHFPDKVVQMAKRRASELEEFGSSDATSDAVEDGTRILKEILRHWAAAYVPGESTEASVKRLKTEIKDRENELENNGYLKHLMATI